jgi:hypothetical protein
MSATSQRFAVRAMLSALVLRVGHFSLRRIRSGVKLRNTLHEQMSSAFLPRTDIGLAYGLILSGAVTRFGFVSGVGVSSMPNPRVNLTGEPYVTDGLRLVLFLNEPRQPFNQIDFLDWERVSP